jgi:hypothetical protein
MVFSSCDVGRMADAPLGRSPPRDLDIAGELFLLDPAPG